MERLFESFPAVTDIRTVTRNNMKKGHYPLRQKGRYSDCLVYAVSGEAHYTFDSYEFDVKDGGLIYLAYDSFYTIDVKSEIFDVIFVDFDFLYNCDKRYYCETAENSGDRTRQLFENIYRSWLAKKSDYQPTSMSLLYGIIADMSELKERSRRGKEKNVIYSSVLYIKEHFCDPSLGMDEIAAASGISRTHFGRVFKEMYGETPKRYIERLRFERARELVSADGLTVSEIAEMCGFSDVYYFSRAFKKEFGIPPSRFGGDGL